MDLLDQTFSLRWQDIFDILLNSYILFRLYVLFRGTNVIRMLVAICILWVLERIAMSNGLIVTTWIIQGIIAAAALIVIIVFRNEIASVFQARSFKSFFWGFPRRQAFAPIDLITESVFELVRHKLGALIVLPLKKGLGEVVHGGIPWQGKLSREMLLSIFWDGTPVHDGAIVIQGDQVMEVATILPLSKSTDLPSNFGTRHRAAAGLTEQTDALVIVVSEERGKVTVFKNKSIIEVKEDAELSQVLRQHVGPVGTRNVARNQLVEICLAAVICLAGVTGIWFSFARGVETLTTLEVPVEFVHRDPKMAIISASESSVKLQISGSGSLIKSVRPDQVKVKLDLSNAVVGSNQIGITRDGIILPPGIELKQLKPQNIEVYLDVPVKKRLPVQVDWTGRLPKDLIMKDIRIVPETVEVEGGHQILKEIRTIYTAKIPLGNITATGTTSVDLVISPSSLKLAGDSEKVVEVHYTVAERQPIPAVEMN